MRPSDVLTATIQYAHNADVEGTAMQKTQANLLRLRCVLPSIDSGVVASMLGIEGKHMDGRRGVHHEVSVVWIEPLENIL